jgi:hypothetical protein
MNTKILIEGVVIAIVVAVSVWIISRVTARSAKGAAKPVHAPDEDSDQILWEIGGEKNVSETPMNNAWVSKRHFLKKSLTAVAVLSGMIAAKGARLDWLDTAIPKKKASSKVHSDTDTHSHADGHVDHTDIPYMDQPGHGDFPQYVDNGQPHLDGPSYSDVPHMDNC